MEDFSFPSVEHDQDHDRDRDRDSHLHHLPFPHFTTSPLWYLPSVAPLEISPHSRLHRSLSGSAKDNSKNINADQNNNYANDDEEKMDMLWENFNEELARASHESDIHEPTTVNGPLVRHRNPSFILFIKVIRKLLFLRKIGAKRRSSSSSSVC